MKITWPTILLIPALLLLSIAFVPPIAHASTKASSPHSTALARAQASGWVGERHDGYVALRRTDVSADVKALVRTVNRQRRGYFTQLAERADTNASKIGRLFALRLLKTAPMGVWFLTVDGDWVRKFAR